ncbi:hypothetical protein [Streptomyces sp. NPDC048191]|uniref:hypothetical protein n=1 Tax=Streptomyces sp. NPDC048191 TaxID=3155484 RepID=UPI0033EDFE53
MLTVGATYAPSGWPTNMHLSGVVLQALFTAVRIAVWSGEVGDGKSYQITDGPLAEDGIAVSATTPDAAAMSASARLYRPHLLLFDMRDPSFARKAADQICVDTTRGEAVTSVSFFPARLHARYLDMSGPSCSTVEVGEWPFPGADGRCQSP